MFRRFSSLVRPKSALKNLFCAVSNFFVYRLFKIQASEAYLSAAFDVMLHRRSFVFVVMFRKITGAYLRVMKTREYAVRPNS